MMGIYSYPSRVPTSKIFFAPMERATRFKNFTWVGLTATSPSPFALLFSKISPSASFLGIKNELWKTSDLVQISCNPGEDTSDQFLERCQRFWRGKGK